MSKAKILKAVRAKCLECVLSPYAVEDCQGDRVNLKDPEDHPCPLFVYRFGEDIVKTRKGNTENLLRANRERKENKARPVP